MEMRGVRRAVEVAEEQVRRRIRPRSEEIMASALLGSRNAARTEKAWKMHGSATRLTLVRRDYPYRELAAIARLNSRVCPRVRIPRMKCRRPDR